MTKRKIYFRADASATIGYGHFVRTLALADMLKNDFDCTFFTSSPSAYQIEEMGKVCNHISLNEETKFEDFINLLEGEEIVVLDNYFFTTEYQKQIKDKGCSLVCVDDMHDKHFVADVVINHGFADPQQYSKELYTKLAIGCNYALLRRPFLNQTEVDKEKGEWIICFGGSDAYDLTSKVAKILDKREDVKRIHAIVGDAYKHLRLLEQINKVVVHSRLSAEEMADLYQVSASVVCSASSVCYEALSCQCTIYAGYYVDNQEEFYKKLSEHKYIIPLGNLLSSDLKELEMEQESFTRKLAINNIISNYRLLFWQLTLRLVDYTQMNENESKLVWKIRNLPEVRMFMADSRPFSFDSHQQFITSLCDDKHRLFYAFFSNNEFVGSFNFTEIGIDSSAERGLFINPEYRGKGIAVILENLIVNHVVKLGITYLVAKVLKNNNPSLSFHHKIGYHLMNEDDRYIYFKKKII
jgi:UDP-2,4-diacetamido-2,4,6-trideoxy-beta-L-altropyranose hydrolase/UDP-4-amino-4,6-dideoxy-N-acetyl-beta-L-altrosamine N-acetyltransferase